jgi:hypothetical protein
VLICTLAAYLLWHLRRAWAPLTYTDEHPPERDNPLAPATRSPHAAAKASRHRDDHNQPLHSFRGLLTHLATLTRNGIVNLVSLDDLRGTVGPARVFSAAVVRRRLGLFR